MRGPTSWAASERAKSPRSPPAECPGCDTASPYEVCGTCALHAPRDACEATGICGARIPLHWAQSFELLAAGSGCGAPRASVDASTGAPLSGRGAASFACFRCASRATRHRTTPAVQGIRDHSPSGLTLTARWCRMRALAPPPRRPSAARISNARALRRRAALRLPHLEDGRAARARAVLEGQDGRLDHVGVGRVGGVLGSGHGERRGLQTAQSVGLTCQFSECIWLFGNIDRLMTRK